MGARLPVSGLRAWTGPEVAAYAVVPFTESAELAFERPWVQPAPPVSVAVLPWAAASAVVVPVPSFIGQYAAGPVPLCTRNEKGSGFVACGRPARLTVQTNPLFRPSRSG